MKPETTVEHELEIFKIEIFEFCKIPDNVFLPPVDRIFVVKGRGEAIEEPMIEMLLQGTLVLTVDPGVFEYRNNFGSTSSTLNQ